MRLIYQHDLDNYIDFIESENTTAGPLSEFVAAVQRVYLADNRPWVIGYSGGKDSNAIMILIYLALLGLPPELRKKPVFVVSSDTLVETPKIIDHVNRSLRMIEAGAKRDKLPITCHKVMPKANNSFWSNLLGKGYPAPTRSFRWCTERIKIDPVSEFIKSQVSLFNEVIVVLGSRSQESSSRAQVIKKHRIEGSDLAVHTSLSNAYIYTPIATWGLDDVWKIIRMCHLRTETLGEAVRHKWEDKYGLEWEAPWGGHNLYLWNLYKDSSAQGECPLVIDETTPSCGSSRFGCWTCTVVTKDKAMESMILNGEEWMLPLLKYRDILARSTSPKLKKKYRNHIRRDGRLAFKTLREDKERVLTEDYTTGPYFLRYRQLMMRLLLRIQKQYNEEKRGVELITVPELHAIRHEWVNDPNEPDWDDSLPTIVFEELGITLDWVIDDTEQFGKAESELIDTISARHGVSPHMVKKLVDLETSMSGLARRHGIFDKIGRIIQQDWESAGEIIANTLEYRQQEMRQSNQVKSIERDLDRIHRLMKAEEEI